MMWKVKRLPSGLGALQKAHCGLNCGTSDEHARTCKQTWAAGGLRVAKMHVCLCVPDEGRPIKKPPEERAFSWESVGAREDGRAIVCHSPILRGGIRTFLLCSAGRFHTTATPSLIRAELQLWHGEPARKKLLQKKYNS